MMSGRRVLVVSETPSLATAVEVLLYAEGIPCASALPSELVHRLRLAQAANGFPVVVAACNEPNCKTVLQWSEEAFPEVSLVVVGGRDPTVRSGGRLYLVRLPLVPSEFVALVRTLLCVPPGRPGKLPRTRGRSRRERSSSVPLEIVERLPSLERRPVEPMLGTRRGIVRVAPS